MKAGVDRSDAIIGEDRSNINLVHKNAESGSKPNIMIGDERDDETADETPGLTALERASVPKSIRLASKKAVETSGDPEVLSARRVKDSSTSGWK